MKILMNYRCFPVAMGRYFHWAFERLGHEVFLVGEQDPRGPDIVPWGDGYSFSKYKNVPNLLIPYANMIQVQTVLDQIDFKPDILIQAGDISWLQGASPIPNIIIGTDPHVINYRPRLEYADKFYCMQDIYMQPYKLEFPDKKMEWLPYAYDPTIHKKLDLEQKYDVVFIGLQYELRMKVLNALKEKYKVFNELGIIYHESNEIYNQGLIAFNWSSQLDVPARIFEGMACGRLMVTNRLPDLAKLGFEEGLHYVGFDTAEEAIREIEYYIANPDKACEIAQRGHEAVKEHTWDARAQKIIEEAK